MAALLCSASRFPSVWYRKKRQRHVVFELSKPRHVRCASASGYVKSEGLVYEFMERGFNASWPDFCRRNGCLQPWPCNVSLAKRNVIASISFCVTASNTPRTPGRIEDVAARPCMFGTSINYDIGQHSSGLLIDIQSLFRGLSAT